MTYSFEMRDGSIVTREGLTDAREQAELATSIHHEEIEVYHDGPDKLIVHVTTPVPVTEHFKPWQRIENPKHAAPHYDGHIPAYTRKRIQATAYRKLDHTGWRIHDGRTGNYRDVINTKEGAHLFTAMRLGELL